MYASDGIARVLAASDWQSILAGLVFVLVSLAAGWVKKRSEAAANSNPTRKAEEDEFEPAEIFDESRPVKMTPRQQKPKRPPIIVVERKPFLARAASPKREKRRAGESQSRVGGTYYHGSKVVQTGTAAKPPIPIQPRMSLAAELGEVAPTVRSSQDGPLIPDLHDATSLRRAIVASEILNPPLALRDPDSTFGHTV